MRGNIVYRKKTYRFSQSNEYAYTWYGEYGRKGEKRGKRKKATPEQIKKQNQKNRENRLRRKIKANFQDNDYWVTVKYPKGTRKPLEEIDADMKKLIRSLRGKWKRAGEDLKYIMRIEVGKNGGPHAHILMNTHPRGRTMEEVRSSWERIANGSINVRPLNIEDAKEVSEYITKQPTEEVQEQLTLFPAEQRKAFVRYTCSRNLEEPEPETKIYLRRTAEKLVREGPKPTPGFYIVKESIRTGINPYTGRSYLYYTENKIRGGDKWIST